MADNPVLITDSTFDGVLKRLYSAYRVKSFPIATKLLAQFQKGTKGGPKNMRWGGEGVRWDVVLTRPTGYVGSDGGFFPESVAALEKQANIGVKRTYVQRQIDRLAALGTESGDTSFIPLARKVAEEALSAARLGQQETLHGAGTGVKATIGTVTDTTHVIVANPYGITGSGRGGLWVDQGMNIAVISSNGVTERGRAHVSSAVNSGDNCTVTFDAAIAGMQAGDVLVACSQKSTENPYGMVPNGLTNLFNRGGSYNNLLGIDAGTYARWNTTRLVAGTDSDSDPSAPNELDVWELAAKVNGSAGFDARETPSEFLLLTTPGLERKIAVSFLGQRAYDAANFMEIKGGFRAINICGIPLISDYCCPAGTIYLIHLPSMTFIDFADWEPVKYQDASSWRPITGRDAFELNWGAFWNAGVLQRNSHAMWTGFTDTARYDHAM